MAVFNKSYSLLLTGLIYPASQKDDDVVFIPQGGIEKSARSLGENFPSVSLYPENGHSFQYPLEGHKCAPQEVFLGYQFPIITTYPSTPK